VTGWVHHIVAFAGQHPHWANILAFVTAMAESVAIIGLFVPGTAILIGIGTIAGLGHLSLWQVLLWAALGAIAGDGTSYWVGHRYRESIVKVWPFSRRPDLLAKSEAFIQRHGAKSIVIGRFVPALRAFVPLAAGVLGMPMLRFYVANILSALAWSPAHILPGALLGVSFGILEGISGRLVGLALALILLLALAAWFLRVVVARAIPAAERLRRRAVDWLRARPPAAHPRGRLRLLFLAVVDPSTPAAQSLVVLGAVLAVATIGFLGVLQDVIARDELARADAALSNLAQGLRTQWGDGVMVAITMLGDTVVAASIAAVAIAWLLWRRYRQLAAGVAVMSVLTLVFVSSLKWLLAVPRPVALPAIVSQFSFPSGHASASAALYGTLAWFAFADARGRGRTWILLALGTLVGAIAASRIYLAAHWPTDVLAGLFFGFGLAASFGLVFRKTDMERLRPSGLVAVCLATLLVVGGAHIALGLRAQRLAYAPREAATTVSQADWLASYWRRLPDNRIDLEGEEREPISLQWAGSVEELGRRLLAAGWSAPPDWSMAELADMARSGADLTALPVMPALNDGIAPLASFVAPGADSRGRTVLRLWPSRVLIATPAGTRPLLLGGLVREHVSHPLGLLSLPRANGRDGEGGLAAMASLDAADLGAGLFRQERADDGTPVILAAP
jgi:membrane protein DedA with SNARE-associated domain/membrane-associated phospholipid phosphatase